MSSVVLQEVSSKDKRKGAVTGVLGFVARSSQQAATLVLTLFAAAWFTPAEYGTYSLSIVFVALVQILYTTGFFQFIITAPEKEEFVLDTCHSLILFLAVLGGGVLAAVAPLVANIFEAPELEIMLWWMAALQPFAAFNSWASAVLMRRKLMRKHFITQVIQSGAGLVAGISAIVITESIYSLLAFVSVRVVMGVFLYLAVLPVRPGKKIDRKLSVQAIRYSVGLYGTAFMTLSVNYAADIVLGIHYSTEEVGVYRMANRFAVVAIDLVGQPLRSFAVTSFGAAARGKREFTPLLRDYWAASALLCGVVAATVAVFIGDVVSLFFDPSYLAAVGVTYALAARGFVSVGYYLVQPVLAARALTGQAMIYYTIWAVIQIALTIVAARLGLILMAWGQALVMFAASASALRFINFRAKLPYRPPLVGSIFALLMVLCYGLAIYAIRSIFFAISAHSLLSLIFSLAVASFLALATLFVSVRMRLLNPDIFDS